MQQERLRQVALSLLPGIGPITIRQLISYCGTASGVFSASKGKLRSIPGVGIKSVETILNNRETKQAATQLKMAAAQDADIHFFTDEDYPHKLKGLEDAPVLLFVKGKPVYNNGYTIGVVGTRRPTNYGTVAIRRILKQLSPYRPTVISGLAYGIDIAAHLEALKLGLPTVAVMGSGLDRIYPDAHRGIAEKMLRQGGLVSELKFGSKPEMYHFPSRNRIIAGLSDTLVVVEARKKGGALITAEYTRNYGKPCFAVPGPIDAPASLGCNELIKNRNAFMLTNGEDIVKQLGWNPTTTNSTPLPVERTTESQILEAIANCPQGVHIDQLCRKTQIPINKIASYLLNLEVQGSIRSIPGRKFILIGK